ncbi:MAG: RimK/LysX family protein [Pseudomonadota bacterium]
MKLLPTAACIGAAALAASLSAAHSAEADTTLGWLEHATIAPSGLQVDAKLDSGAKTSAIHAEILRGPGAPTDEAEEDENGETLDVEPRRDKMETVVFRLSNEDGESTTLEREIVRYVNVKLRGSGVDRRPVVMLELCLAGVPIAGEVNLTDRSRFNYPLLVGRTMLAQADILIDPRKIYTVDSVCPEPDASEADEASDEEADG